MENERLYRHAVERDDLDFAYLVSQRGDRETMRIGVIGPDEEVGKGRFAKLVPIEQEHVIAIFQEKLPEWFDHVGDAVQDDLLDWIGEHTGHEWSVRGDMDEDRKILILYSFANAADAVSFKLRWSDRVK